MNNNIIYIFSYSLARISLYSLQFTAGPESDGDFFDKQKYVQTVEKEINGLLMRVTHNSMKNSLKNLRCKAGGGKIFSELKHFPARSSRQ